MIRIKSRLELKDQLIGGCGISGIPDKGLDLQKWRRKGNSDYNAKKERPRIFLTLLQPLVKDGPKF
jgi:hypothetical protein